MIAGVLPDRMVGTTPQTPFGDVGAARVEIRELSYEPCREVFVEEQHRLLS